MKGTLLTLTQQEFDAILGDDTKAISGDIIWVEDDDHSPAIEFKMEVESALGHPIFVHGRYNPLSGTLSYSIIHRSIGRIYGLDLGASHRNPDGERLGDRHKHRWKDGFRNKVAYVPQDITAPWNRPIETWTQFCAEANLRHSGTMLHPQVQRRLQI